MKWNTFSYELLKSFILQALLEVTEEGYAVWSFVWMEDGRGGGGRRRFWGARGREAKSYLQKRFVSSLKS